MKITSKYQCPDCGSYNTIKYDEYIECTSCKLKFPKDFIDSKIPKENLLAKQELGAIVNEFDEFKDKKIQKKFIEDLKRDLLDLQDL